MDKKYTHCTDCDREFKQNDEVVETDAGGGKVIVHVDCLYGFLTRWSNQTYFDTHEDMVRELELDLKD